MTISEPVQPGPLIRRFRVANGLSQEQLAERSGLSARAVSDLERGLRTQPRPETLRMLGDALELGPEDRDALLAAARPDLLQPTPQPEVRRATNSLPRPRSALIGRRAEVGDALDRLGSGAKLLTLTGPGGVGKTRIALEIAGRAIDDASVAAVFVDLSSISDHKIVLSAIAQALGVHESGGQSIQDSLLIALRHRKLLLVLDNFEQVIDAAPQIGDLIAAAHGLQVLVTSREVLRIREEQEIVVEPLALPPGAVDDPEALAECEAVRLFVDAAAATSPGFALTAGSAGDIVEICRKLDGLPLAIELAASRVKHFPPGVLLERLDRRLPVLTGGKRDAPGRQQTLRNTISWSYDLLTPDEQALFRRVGAFPGGATLDALDLFATVADELEVDLVAGLTSLMEKSLVRERTDPNNQPRFFMLETIREFAGEMIAVAGEVDAGRDAVLAWSLALADGGKADLEAWLMGGENLRELDEEVDNLRLGFQIAADRHDAESHVRLFVGTKDYFYLRGWFREATERGNAGLALAEVHPIPERLRGVALGSLSTLWNTLYDGESAERQAREALDIARDHADSPEDVICALCALVMAIRDQGRYGDALPFAREAERLAESTDSRSIQPLTTFALGKLAQLMDDQDAAVEYLTIALERSLAFGVNSFAFHSASLLAAAFTRRGDRIQAASTLRRSVELWRSAGNIGADSFLDEAAVLAATVGEMAVSATLFGAHAGQNAYFGARGEDDRWTLEAKETARRQLGDEAYAAVEMDGQKMSMDEAIELVLRLVDEIEERGL